MSNLSDDEGSAPVVVDIRIFLYEAIPEDIYWVPNELYIEEIQPIRLAIQFEGLMASFFD